MHNDYHARTEVSKPRQVYHTLSIAVSATIIISSLFLLRSSRGRQPGNRSYVVIQLSLGSTSMKQPSVLEENFS